MVVIEAPSRCVAEIFWMAEGPELFLQDESGWGPQAQFFGGDHRKAKGIW